MASIQDILIAWLDHNGRDLPMRAPDVSPWGTLVFEVMSQQTPIQRVQPIWQRWMTLWPTPAALAEASPSSILVEWDRLGYPSRALRLQQCAQAIATRPGGEVPADYEALLALPGIGPYTASALASFQFHQRIAVLDTNVRRVITRVWNGEERAASASPSRDELQLSHSLLPDSGALCARWNLAIMEFGALVCTARSPLCHSCPIAKSCLWREAGHPKADKVPPSQKWKGTDRQARGQVMAALRQAHTDRTQDQIPDTQISPEQASRPSPEHHLQGISREDALAAATLPGAETDQAHRVLSGLLKDGLIEETSHGRFILPR